jgi:glycerophosphoryl diester phosphodiesterase
MTRIPLPDSFVRLPITHRALHDREQGRVENSASAVKAAVAAGYGIEVDLQLSKDGAAMVFHDEDLDRLTDETGPLNARTAAELARIRLRDSPDTIPTLAEVLQLIDGKVPLLIEIKDQTLLMGPTDGKLEAATAKALEGYKGDVALMSFNPHSIAHMARLAPHLPRGITTSAYDPDDWAPLPSEVCDRLRPIPDYDATGSSFISHEGRDLARPRVAALKAQGAKILCWTIRSPEAEAAARRIADNVTFEGYMASLPA